MRPEPPPLEPGSDAARILHDLWSGRRLVIAPNLPEAVVTAAAIASHMHQRAGSTIQVVAPEVDRDRVIEALVDAMPPGTVGDHAVFVNGPPVAGIPPVPVVARYEEARPDRSDLVIVLGAYPETTDDLHRCLLAGRQLLDLGSTSLTPHLDLDPVDHGSLPLDIAIAGD